MRRRDFLIALAKGTAAAALAAAPTQIGPGPRDLQWCGIDYGYREDYGSRALLVSERMVEHGKRWFPGVRVLATHEIRS